MGKMSELPGKENKENVEALKKAFKIQLDKKHSQTNQLTNELNQLSKTLLKTQKKIITRERKLEQIEKGSNECNIINKTLIEENEKQINDLLKIRDQFEDKMLEIDTQYSRKLSTRKYANILEEMLNKNILFEKINNVQNSLEQLDVEIHKKQDQLTTLLKKGKKHNFKCPLNELKENWRLEIDTKIKKDFIKLQFCLEEEEKVKECLNLSYG